MKLLISITTLICSLVTLVVSLLVFNASRFGLTNKGNYYSVNIKFLPSTTKIYHQNELVTTGYVYFNDYECIYSLESVEDNLKLRQGNDDTRVGFYLQSEGNVKDFCANLNSEGRGITQTSKSLYYFATIINILLVILLIYLLCAQNYQYDRKIPKFAMMVSVVAILFMLPALILNIISRTNFYDRLNIDEIAVQDNLLPNVNYNYLFIVAVVVSIIGLLLVILLMHLLLAKDHFCCRRTSHHGSYGFHNDSHVDTTIHSPFKKNGVSKNEIDTSTGIITHHHLSTIDEITKEDAPKESSNDGYLKINHYFADISHLNPNLISVFQNNIRVFNGSVGFNEYECIYTPQIIEFDKDLDQGYVNTVNINFKIGAREVDLCRQIILVGKPFFWQTSNGIFYQGVCVQAVIIIFLCLIPFMGKKDKKLAKAIFIISLIDIISATISIIIGVSAKKSFYARHSLTDNSLLLNMPEIELNGVFVSSTLCIIASQIILALLMMKNIQISEIKNSVGETLLGSFYVVDISKIEPSSTVLQHTNETITNGTLIYDENECHLIKDQIIKGEELNLLRTHKYITDVNFIIKKKRSNDTVDLCLNIRTINNNLFTNGMLILKTTEIIQALITLALIPLTCGWCNHRHIPNLFFAVILTNIMTMSFAFILVFSAHVKFYERYGISSYDVDLNRLPAPYVDRMLVITSMIGILGQTLLACMFHKQWITEKHQEEALEMKTTNNHY
uniref:Transmembrane domain-containing protein n=1 Tax=Rhabditophanes sp. KR3021 TaxID=114890 RepID=A0AC35UEY0_9BILA